MMSFRGRVLLLSLLAFVYGSWCIYTSKRDLGLAANEGIAHGIAKLHQQSKNSSIFDTGRCDFRLEVDGRPYVGYGVCPKEMIPSQKWSAMDYALGGPVLNVTVYYDPSNPMTNSLRDFTTQSQWDSRKADISLAAGFVLVLFWPFSSLISGLRKMIGPEESEDTRRLIGTDGRADL